MRTLPKIVTIMILLTFVLVACQADPEIIEVTTIVEREVETIVEQTVEVTTVVEREVEVIVEQTVEVEVTTIVEQIVEVEVTPEPAPEEDSGPPPFEPPTDVIVSGLAAPRQMHYTADGSLYISEAGVAGSESVPTGPESATNLGLTSQISRFSADGELETVLPALPSILVFGGARGAQAIYVTDDAYWVGIGEAPPGMTASEFRVVQQIDRNSGRVLTSIDTFAAAIEAGQPDSDRINSDPTDLAVSADGTLYITDAGCNCLWSWTEADGLQAFVLWDAEDNPVPTGTAIGPDGDIYVSTLSGFPFPEGGARIERWSPAGELVQTYGDLTLLTDVLVGADGTIYAVEFAEGFGDTGYIPDSGRVIMVSEDGVTPLLEGLRFPYGLAQAPDGSLVVSIGSAFGSADSGMVIAVPLP